MLLNDLLDASSARTPPIKLYDAILNPALASWNLTKMKSDSASSVAFCTDAPACSAKMGLASSLAILRISFSGYVVLEALEIDWSNAGAESFLISA